MSRVEEILSLVKHIPAFPKVAQQVMAVMDNPETSARDLAEIIQYDQAITANVLKICNAAYFGLPRKVSSLDEAVVVIGQDILKDIIITSSSARFYKGAVGAGYQLGQGELWKHSVACAIMARLIAARVGGVDPGNAFTAGLLHDIGKRILSSFVADDFNRIIEKTEQGMAFSEAETEVIGITHSELGGMIMDKWKFPEEIIAAVKNHHAEDVLSMGNLSVVVGLANSLVISMGIGVGVDGLATRMRGEKLKEMGLDERNLDLLMAELVTEMEKAEDLFNIH